MCDTNAYCANNDGSYECTCNDNYAGNGFKCSECLSTTIDYYVLIGSVNNDH